MLRPREAGQIVFRSRYGRYYFEAKAFRVNDDPFDASDYTVTSVEIDPRNIANGEPLDNAETRQAFDTMKNQLRRDGWIDAPNTGFPGGRPPPYWYSWRFYR